MDLDIHEKNEGITLKCYVKPKAKRNQIKGVREGALAVALNTPPLEGRANRELIKFIASALNVPPSRITLLQGERSRNKVLFIHRVSKKYAISRLGPHIG